MTGGPFRVIWLAAAVLLLAGCGAFVDDAQPVAQPATPARLASGHALGQTFVARHGGLNGMDLWLQAEPGSQGQVRWRLRDSAETGPDLAAAELPLAPAGGVQLYHFAFSPLAGSNSRYFYALLEFDGQGALQAGAAPGGTYRDGSLYVDGEPAPDGQLRFRLSYATWPLLLSFGQAVVGDLGLLAMALLIFVVPGWALIAWLLRETKLSWGETLGLAAGLGLALTSVWLVWTDLLGLHLGALNVWLPVLAGLVALVLRYGRGPRAGFGRLGLPGGRPALYRWACSPAIWPDLALAGVLALLFTSRLLVVQAMDAPSWGDAVQHAAIGQLMLDRGGLFTSWQPYAPYQTLSIHFGFSGYAAYLGWALGLNGTTATLWAGQLLNGLAVLTLYPLAVRLAGGWRWAGVATVLVAGLLSPMPAFYVNWGRFAQLGGQAILPVALWLLLELLERTRFSWRPLALAALAGAGMTLAYYRMPYFYGVFVIAWLIGFGIPHWRGDLRLWARRLARLAPAAILMLLLFWPYLTRLSGGSLEAGLAAAPAASPLVRVIQDYQQWGSLATYVPPALQVVALLALLWSLWRRRWTMAAVGLWAAGLFLLVASRLIHVPGANYLENFAVLIALYMPASILAGWLAGELIDWLAAVVWRAGSAAHRQVSVAAGGRTTAALGAQDMTAAGGQVVYALAAVVLVGVAAWGAGHQLTIAEPPYMLVNRPDTRAMAWIREHTPADARFLAEGFRTYSGRSAVGADAGWWLPLLAGRANTMPPQYAMFNERPIQPGYTQGIVDLVARLETTAPASPEGIRGLCDQGVTHVYIGQGQGAVGFGVSRLYNPEPLLASPLFHLVYHQDRVYVFALDPTACRQAAGG